MSTLLNTHTLANHNAGGGTMGGGSSTSAPRLEKLPRPTFQLDMTQSEWAFKYSQWQAYISQTPTQETIKVQQLRAACTDDLLRRVYDTGDLANMNTEELLIKQVKKIAVRVVHKTLHLQNMWSMVQAPEETVRAFVSRLLGTAELCDLFITCSKIGCFQKTSYRDEVVQQALLKGMSDSDIRTRVLSRTQNNELVGLTAVVDYIAAEEAAAASFSRLSNTIAATKSSYKQQQTLHHDKNETLPLRKCKHCGKKHPGDSSPDSRKEYCKAYDKKCAKCDKNHHFSSVCRSAPKAAAVTTQGEPSVTGSITVPDAAGFYAMQTAPPFTKLNQRWPSPHPWEADNGVSRTCGGGEGGGNSEEVPVHYKHLQPIIANLAKQGPVTTVPLPHLVHTKHAGWLAQLAMPSPTLHLSAKIDRAAYADLRLPIPKPSLRPARNTRVLSCADTGAQLTTVPISILAHLGLNSEDLFPISTNLNTVTGAPVDLLGGLLLEFSGVNPKTGVGRSTRQLAYVSTTVPYPFLSREACADLGLIPADFPSIGSFGDNNSIAAVRCTNNGVENSDDLPCACPLRQLPPAEPPTLPCKPTVENLPILRQHIIDRYAASAFNTCERQPLPLIKDSPPLRLFVDEKAKPVAVHTPAAVPLHWDAQVQAGLDRDVRLGVIERVPVNTPTTWCSRMLAVAKHDGSPRRVVDYQAVNDHCPRQTHHTQSPWQIASAVPPNTVKTVLDCWHGYHSVPIHPQDRHVTTFITKGGRYQYRTAPQGLLSAGDAYTQRFDEIIGNFPNHLKCVDDSILWGTSIEENFFATCAFLDKCSASGIIFNESKFQFAQDEVDYLGFNVTKTGLKPTQEFINNIKSFPTPKSLTDVRSWFGCVQQIAYTFAVSEVMFPFRQLLRPQVPFVWTKELEDAFQASKLEIIRQCEQGVRLFTMTAPTGLATDWSKNSMGWWLVQKHCSCPGPPKLGCCKTGWQTVFCGSKFNSKAQSRYAPIEGEAAALLLGLEKCSHFILGLPDLLLAVDHKPLVSIFGSSSLESIPNPRLFKMREKALKYRFTPCHVPGKKNVVPDTFSRRGDAPNTQDEHQSNVGPEYPAHMGPPSWVSQPTLGSCTSAAQYEPNNTPLSDEADSLTEVDDYVRALAMSNLQFANTPVELINASMTVSTLQAVTWDTLEAACAACPEYLLLHRLIEQGVPKDSKDWEQTLLPYYRHRHALSTIGPVVLVHDRPVVPKSLRTRVMDHIHAGHPGLSTMCQRLSRSLYWPNYRDDLTKAKLNCSTCLKIAPSNPAMPPRPPVAPQYPFQSVVCDFFAMAGHTYVALADRYSNWVSVFKLKQDTSAELIGILRGYFATFGVPEIFSSDGASIFTSSLFKDFCKRWGIEQRISSAYHARSNKRAEVAVKQAKRLVQDSLGPAGTLNTDSLARALLAQRNTPDSLTGLSPAQVLFGRPLRDFLPLGPGKYTPRPEWRITAEQREIAHAKRHIKTEEALRYRSKQLPPLSLGDAVSVQDQQGNTPRRWSKTGRVVEVLGNDAYTVKVDGSNRVTQRNRQFLRKISPFQADTDEFPIPESVPQQQPSPIIDAPDAVADKDTISISGPPSHPREVDNGVSRTSGGGEEGGLSNVEPKEPPHIKLKLYRTSSGWSTCPDPQPPTTVQQEVKVNPSLLKPQQQTACPPQEQASLLVPTGPHNQPVQQPAYYPLPYPPQGMNPFTPIPSNTVLSNPMLCYNVAYTNPFMLQDTMMPRQPYSNSLSYYVSA